VLVVRCAHTHAGPSSVSSIHNVNQPSPTGGSGSHPATLQESWSK
jgi:hypothetical protein